MPLRGIAGTAPDWVHAQANAPIPTHDDKTDAVLLYAETVLTVETNGTLVRRVRRAYKILRPEGERYGVVPIYFNFQSRVRTLRGWCIPAAGKDYGVSEGDAIESGLPGLTNGGVASDLRIKVLRIPAAVPGNIVAYEIEQELWPFQIADTWVFQETVPVREAHYTLSLPPGWSYSAVWLNHAEQAPSASGANQWHWMVQDVAGIRVQPHMPPLRGIAGQLVIAPIAPGGQVKSLASWHDIGAWYLKLTQGRRDPASELTNKVAELTASKPTVLEKMRALAEFVQNDIRYVAIELGIGSYQPHSATAVFTNRYGDCKDKVTLLSAMLKQIGVDSYYVLINTERGSITAKTPPNLGFNHAILAVQLPAGLQDPTLMAQTPFAGIGTVLFFDPTDDLTPFGYLRGQLQGNYGMLVAPDGGALLALPQSPLESNGIHRTAKLTLDEQGKLRGDVQELRIGDRASQQRHAIRNARQDTDRIKPVEALVSDSFATVTILRASIGNLRDDYKPFEWNYSLEAENYAKLAGDLLMVRPRIIGSDALGFLETKELREQAIEFSGPESDSDLFEVALPVGYRADDLPPPVDLDYGFASYHSKSELIGQMLRYARTLEVKELSVPASKAEDLRAFYRAINSDERKVAVLRKISP